MKKKTISIISISIYYSSIKSVKVNSIKLVEIKLTLEMKMKIEDSIILLLC